MDIVDEETAAGYAHESTGALADTLQSTLSAALERVASQPLLSNAASSTIVTDTQASVSSLEEEIAAIKAELARRQKTEETEETVEIQAELASPVIEVVEEPALQSPVIAPPTPEVEIEVTSTPAEPVVVSTQNFEETIVECKRNSEENVEVEVDIVDVADEPEPIIPKQTSSLENNHSDSELLKNLLELPTEYLKTVITSVCAHMNWRKLNMHTITLLSPSEKRRLFSSISKAPKPKTNKQRKEETTITKPKKAKLGKQRKPKNDPPKRKRTPNRKSPAKKSKKAKAPKAKQPTFSQTAIKKPAFTVVRHTAEDEDVDILD